MKRKYIFLAIGALVIAGAIGYFMSNKPHADLTKKEAAFTLSSQDLHHDFTADEAAANEMYLDQLIQVTGPIKEISSTADGGYVVILGEPDEMSGVSCSVLAENASSVENLKAGETATFKGICSGMLIDVSLSRCILVK